MKTKMLSLALALAGIIAQIPQQADSRSWRILPDGTGDAPSIAAGIDSAAAGDTVSVGCGTYYEYDIRTKSGVCVRGDCADPAGVVIDASGEHAFFASVLGPDVRIERLRITDAGRAIEVSGGSIYLLDCVIDHSGGGFRCGHATAELRGCVFAMNSTDYGGALRLEDGSSVLVSGCTLYGNYAWTWGGGIDAQYFTNVELDKSIIAASTRGVAVHCDVTSAAFAACCDVFGNAGGDWVQGLRGQDGVSRNFSADPMVCSPTMLDFRVNSSSPCVRPQLPSDCGDYIGALAVGCGTSDVKGPALMPTSWGRMKSLYR